MSEYLETLVENMLADNVSEKDIQKVIEEVTKKSPLAQIETETTKQDGGGGDIILGAEAPVVDPVVTEEPVITKEPEVKVKEVEPTCPDCNGEPVKPDENGICPECIQETTEDKIAKEDKGKVTEIPKEHPAKPEREQPKTEIRELPYVHPYANKDLSIKSDFFSLDEDQAVSEFKNIFGGLGVKAIAANVRQGGIPIPGTNAIKITFPGQDPEIFNLRWDDPAVNEAKFNEILNNYINELPGKREGFDVYAKAVFELNDKLDLSKATSRMDLEVNKFLSSAQLMNNFQETKEYEEIATNADKTITDEGYRVLRDEIYKEVEHLTYDEKIDYYSSANYLTRFVEGYDKLLINAMTSDKSWQNTIDMQEAAIGSVYDGRIASVTTTEAEEEHIPKALRIISPDFLTGIYETGRFTFPMAWANTAAMYAAIKVREVESLIRELELRDIDPKEKVILKKSITWFPRSRIGLTTGEQRKEKQQITKKLRLLAGEYTAEELLKRLSYMGDWAEKQFVEKFSSGKKYQEIMDDLGAVRFFTDEGFQWDIDDWQRVLGVQGMQAISAIFTGGLNVYAQEASELFASGLVEKSAKRLGIDVDTFRRLKDDQQMELMLAALEDGAVDSVIMNSKAHGFTATTLEMVGDVFVIMKGAKLLPKSLSLQLFKESWRTFLKTGWKEVGKDGFKTFIVEEITEILQEVSRDFYSYMADLEIPPALDRYREVAFQTAITVPFIFGGTKAITTTYDRMKSRYLSWRDPNAQKYYIVAIDNQIKVIQNDPLIEAEDKVSMIADLEATKVMLSDKDNLSKTPEAKKKIIAAAIKMQNSIKEKNELEAKNKKLDKNSEEYKNNQRKIYNHNRRIKRANDRIHIVRSVEKIKVDSREKVRQINEKDDGKTAHYFKTKEEFKQFLKQFPEGYFTKEELDAFLNGDKLGVTSAEGDYFVACEEILEEKVKDGDWAAANTIYHEGAHFDMFNKSLEELEKMKAVVERTLEEGSKVDHQLKAILSAIKSRQIQYALQALAEGRVQDPKTVVEEWFTAFSDALGEFKMQDFTMEGSAYWSDMAETLEDFLNVENVTEETALEFIRRFNLNGSKNGKPVTHTWWLDDFNKPIIQTIWDTQAADIVSNEKAFKNQRVPKYSKSTIYSDGTEVLIKKSEAIYGVKKRTNEEVSNENKRIQQKIIDAESYIFENKNDQYTEERANQIQQDTRDGEKARYKNLFVLNNVKGVLTIINGKYVEGGSVSRYDFEAAVFAELGKIIALGEKGGYKPLLTEEEWNEFITEAKEKNPDFIPPSKIQNKEIEGIRNITNPVNFWAYTKPVLVFRVPGIWDKLIENAKQQYYVDLDEATNIAGDYDVETVLDLQQLIDEYEEISELKEILKIENDDAIYIKVSDEVYRLMGEKIQHVNSETFTQDFRNEARELFWKQIKMV